MLEYEVSAHDKPKRIAECVAHTGADDSRCPDGQADAGAKRVADGFPERCANVLAVCAPDVSAFFVSIKEPK